MLILQQILPTPLFLYLAYSVSRSWHAFWLALQCMTPVKSQSHALTFENIPNKDRGRGSSVLETSSGHSGAVRHCPVPCSKSGLFSKWSCPIPSWIFLRPNQHLELLCFEGSLKYLISMNGALMSSIPPFTGSHTGSPAQACVNCSFRGPVSQ